jgi:hypothetical protein
VEDTFQQADNAGNTEGIIQEEVICAFAKANRIHEENMNRVD